MHKLVLITNMSIPAPYYVNLSGFMNS